MTEEKWQKFWLSNQSVSNNDTANNLHDDTSSQDKEKYYVLEMFPYPSGNIHMGHLRNYTIGDVVARYKQQSGYDVLHPIGFDAFGLPAENAAIENNIHPEDWTYKNIETMRQQLKSIGLLYDWQCEVVTCSPDYYQHEQAMFLDFLENDIAYRKESVVNWDPVDNTVLANEQVIDGKGWRSGADIERRELSQWFLKITDFADELLNGLDNLKDWPNKVRIMQENWIGKSSGLSLRFSFSKQYNISADNIEVYTTRPDTLFGAAFIAIAPDHPVAKELAKDNPAIQEFIDECNKIGLSQDVIDKAEKKGIDTKITLRHPTIDGTELPLFIANFVLSSYGSGAVFGCPAHDQRDLDFAIKYDLPIVPVILPNNQENIEITKEAYNGDGKLINSDFLNGLDVKTAKEKMINFFENKKQGNRKTNYRLRDWGISRQRYWGCPIPVIYCDNCGIVPVDKKDLPVELPKDISFEQAGNPLDNHPTWKYTKCPKCNNDAIRETDTFDTFFESSWYFARYCSPNSANGIDKNLANYWLPVDQYVGGIEHAVMHLLYARFFSLALNKCQYFDVKEPFKRLLTQGMVCHETYQDSQGNWLFPEQVTINNNDKQYVTLNDGLPVKVGRMQKMSKSKKNVVDPMNIINSYGADTARLFMLSDSPPERDLEWSDAGIDGAWKYINRLWRLAKNIIDLPISDNNKQPDYDNLSPK
ncbi:MAG: leucine--tRNA ligase, partial [Pseudomonadota bacterium]